MFKYAVLFSIPLLVSCASTIRSGYGPNENHYEYIIVHNKLKNDAYAIAENWVAKNYNSANDVVQQKDKDNGVLVIKAIAPFSIMIYTRYVHYTMEIRVKDNKSKISFDLGGLAGGGEFHEQPEMTPPADQMPIIVGQFTKIKDQLEKEWNKEKTATSDF